MKTGPFPDKGKKEARSASPKNPCAGSPTLESFRFSFSWLMDDTGRKRQEYPGGNEHKKLHVDCAGTFPNEGDIPRGLGKEPCQDAQEKAGKGSKDRAAGNSKSQTKKGPRENPCAQSQFQDDPRNVCSKEPTDGSCQGSDKYAALFSVDKAWHRANDNGRNDFFPRTVNKSQKRVGKQRPDGSPDRFF